MKKKIFYSVTIFFLISCILFLGTESKRFTGYNYLVTGENITNLKKISDFYQRYNNYKKLVKKINSNNEKRNKIIDVSTWVYDNIKKISVDDVIIDSHPWTIVERQMGARDQFSDILSVLFIYSNIDSFFKMSFGQIYHPLTFFKNNNNWSIIDPYYGVYFLNDRNQFCNLNEHKSKKCFFFHLEFGKISNDVLSKIFFDKNFKNLIELNNYYNLLFEAFPNALEIKNTNIYLRGGRSYVQKPTHRLIYELQKIFN
tara:strand:+ start:1194 stop:1961 length:768 start_codon:yes stop_codon:yes gene_type:complete